MSLPSEQSSNYAIADMMGWSATVLFGYDILITMPEEVRLVWCSRWSIPKLLYLLSRYGGFLLLVVMDIVSPNISPFAIDCRIYNATILLTVILSAAACDCLLVFRVTSMFFERRRVVLGIWGLFTAVISAELAITAVYFATSLHLPSSATQGANCSILFVVQGHDTLAPCLALMLVLNCVLFVLHVVYLLPFCWRNGGMGTTMFSFLLREGSAYFAAIAVVYALTFTVQMSLSDRPDLQSIMLFSVTAIPPVASNRLFLNLRGLIHKPTDFTSFPTPAPVRFRMPADVHNGVTPSPCPGTEFSDAPLS